MIIDNPSPKDIPALRRIWQQAFGDTDEFLDGFFETGFAFDRCWCVFQGQEPVAAVYVFPCGWAQKKVAYLYALAVERSHQKQGLSRLLLTDVHAKLHRAGYAGAIMEPATESLRQYYETLGYRSFGGRQTCEFTAQDPAEGITELPPLAYELARKRLLPAGGIAQEGAFIAMLQKYAVCYGGDGFVATVSRDEPFVMEFLGDTNKIPGLLQALQLDRANVRLPGGPATAVYLDFAGEEELPAYFGLPMD